MDWNLFKNRDFIIITLSQLLIVLGKYGSTKIKNLLTWFFIQDCFQRCFGDWLNIYWLMVSFVLGCYTPFVFLPDFSRGIGISKEESAWFFSIFGTDIVLDG